MDASERGAIWDEVWAEYDLRQAMRSPHAPAAVEGAAVWPGPGVGGGGSKAVGPGVVARRPGGRAALRPLVQVAAAATAAMALLGLWLVLPLLLAARLSAPLGAADARELLRQFDPPAAMASLREGLQAEVDRAQGAGARRFLSGMADRMAASWERPERVAAWMAVRSRGGRGEGSPVALSNLRSARPLGLSSFRLEYGPAGEAAGMEFDLSWREDGFRVTALRFLDAPAWPAATLVAMR